MRTRRAMRPRTGLIAAFLALFAAPALVPVAVRVQASPAHSKMDKLSVQISRTGGTVWGTVTASYKSQGKTVRASHSSARFTLHLPPGTTVHLSQTPTDQTTWPFKEWDVTSGGAMKVMSSPSISLKLNGNVSVIAVYVASGGSNYPYPPFR